jgi:hypothetical protein
MRLDELIAQATQNAPERTYPDWLRTQPSALSSGFSWDGGTPFCEPAHWHTARYAGVGTKPEYLAIPRAHQEHALQHRIGQYTFKPRDWWQEQCIIHLERWLAS